MKSSSKQEIIFVTGKGGVGKSAVAASMALHKAQQGRKTLLVELGDQSFYKDYFNLAEVTYQPQKLRENLELSLWSGAEALKEYLIYLLRVESIYKLFFENPVSKALVQVAPALPELAILGKITSGPRKVGPPLNYDTIVVDAFATGHFLALLRAPRGMAEAIKYGPMGDQSRSIEKVMSDPEQTRFFVVSFPEEMPVLEGEELAQEITKLLGTKPTHVFNRYVQVPDGALTEKAETPELKEFQSTMENFAERQNSLLRKLENSGYETIKLSQIFDSDPWRVVEGMAAELGSLK